MKKFPEKVTSSQFSYYNLQSFCEQHVAKSAVFVRESFSWIKQQTNSDSMRFCKINDLIRLMKANLNISVLFSHCFYKNYHPLLLEFKWNNKMLTLRQYLLFFWFLFLYIYLVLNIVFFKLQVLSQDSFPWLLFFKDSLNILGLLK